ncbi:MAG: hypothetical protein L0271_17475 [Gemmatimonadetes bacterium]|nr:hypothetical protein [Gemmatimonadota bacterium]
MSRWKLVRGAALLIITVGACEPAIDEETLELMDPAGSGLPVRLLAQLDTAAQAYTSGDALAASRLYRAVALEQPDLAPAWFGLYLSERTLGNTASADSALARATQTARADSAGLRPRS